VTEILTAYIALFACISLAVHVVTRAPRRLSAWAFAGFVTCIGIIYLINLFLFHSPEDPISTAQEAGALYGLRIKWSIISLLPALYFHFTWFYFPANIRRLTRRVVPVFYFLSAGFLLASLFTQFVVSGVVYRPSENIFRPLFSPGILLYIIFLLSTALVSSGALIIALRRTHSVYLRNQILGLLTPFVLLMAAAVFNWIIIQANSEQIFLPPIFDDVLVILAAFIYASVIVQFGSVTGRPGAIRSVFFTLSGTLLALMTLSLTLTVDLYLSTLVGGPLPLLTSLLVTALIAGFPVFMDGINWLQQHLFKRGETAEPFQLVGLQELNIEDPELLRDELLASLVRDVRAGGAFVAELVPAPFNPALDLDPEFADIEELPQSPSSLQVVAQFGRLPLRPGQRLPAPSSVERRVTPAAALTPQEMEAHAWYGLAAYCELAGTTMPFAVLAVCKPGMAFPVTEREINIIQAYAGQIEVAQQIIHLDQKRRRSLEAATDQEAAIRQHETRFQGLLSGTSADPGHAPGTIPLRIGLLGPLEVTVKGQPVPESAWESERARELLGYLLWKGSAGAASAELAEALWPDRAPEQSANSLYVTINRLRRVLELDLERPRDSRYILSDGGRYRFNYDAPHHLDVDEFMQLAASSNANQLRQAVELYRGPYLENSDWSLPPDVEAHRRNLEQIFLQCLRRLATQTTGQEDLHYLRRLLAVEPLDESANLQLAERLLARGRTDLAFEQLAQYRRLLEEVDEQPSDAMRLLWRKVERGMQEFIP
jgi:DNA-binding SARP family transcriptional activator